MRPTLRSTSSFAALAFMAFLLGGCATGSYDSAQFHSRLDEIAARAKAEGVSPATIGTHLQAAQYLPRVIELDRNQPEFKLDFDTYRDRVISNTRVQTGVQRFQVNKTALKKIERQTGVPGEIVTALWGIETNFGQITGGFNVVDALATLAYDGRRSAYFEGELIQALKLIDKNPTLPTPLMGSWAGAMGQFQFMPSSYNNFAINADSDKVADLWRSEADGLASAANYLQKSGWQAGLRYGDAVQLPPGEISPELIGIETQKTVAQWQKLGLRSISGHPLPAGNTKASLLVMDDAGTAFLVYANYRCILKWNRSHNFALTVGLLSDRIKTGSKTPQS